MTMHFVKNTTVAMMMLLASHACGPGHKDAEEPEATVPPETTEEGVDAGAEAVESEQDVHQKKLDEKLVAAAEEANWEEAKNALNEGADVQALVQRGGMGQLHLAVLTGDEEELGAILEEEPELDETTFEECTALHMAAALASLPMVTTLTEAGADTRALDDRGYTPLHWAAEVGSLEILKFFVEKKKVSPAKLGEDATPILVAAVRSGNVDVAKYLTAKGAKVALADEDGMTPLHHAAASNDVPMATFLLTKGAKVAAKDADGRTPLHVAASDCPESGSSCIEMAKLLIKKGAKKNLTDAQGLTPYDDAQNAGDDELAALLEIPQK